MHSKFGPRVDEAGNTLPAAATVLPSSPGHFTATGVVGSRTDVDVWRVAVTGTGMLTVTATPWVADLYYAGTNLDIVLRVRDADGTQLAAASPDDDTAASVSVSVSAGDYFISISGGGRPAVYSDYGSLGQYDLLIEAPHEDTTTTDPTTTVATSTTTVATTTTTVGDAAVTFGDDCVCVPGTSSVSSGATVSTTADADGRVSFCVQRDNHRGDVSATIDYLGELRYSSPQLEPGISTMCVRYRPLLDEADPSTVFGLTLVRRRGSKATMYYEAAQP